MRLALKHCKDNAALRQSRVAPKPCERSRGAQFRDNAGATDGRASLLSLSEDLARGCIVIRWKNAAAGKKVLQFFEKFEPAFGLQFLTQRIERACVSDFAQRNSNKRSAVESGALAAS